MSFDSNDLITVAVGAFIAYVEENPDNYKSLVRGAASGDAQMRAIFDATRATLAGRVVDVVGQLGFQLGPRAELAVHGWVAFTEECTIRWIDTASTDRAALEDMLTKALPAVVLASTDEQIGSLVSILTADQAIAAK